MQREEKTEVFYLDGEFGLFLSDFCLVVVKVFIFKYTSLS